MRDLAVRQARVASVQVVVSNTGSRNEDSVVDAVGITRVACLGTIASMPLCPGMPGAIRRFPSDLVHLHTPNPGAAYALSRSGHKGALVITHHADTIGRRALRLLSDTFVRRAMDRAAVIIVTSQRYLETSEELAPYRSKCRIIPLGIELNESSVENDLSEDVGRKAVSRIILAVGRLVRYKGFDVLVRAMKNVDGRLVLIGSGPEEAKLRALIESEAVGAKVEMLGRVADLAPYYKDASMFVLPSVTRAEAFGIVQLEAMAAGLPVINTNIDSGVPEISVDGETGLTVEPYDFNGLAHAIQLLLDRQELREQLGRAAQAKVRGVFTVDRMAERTFNLYRDVLAGKCTAG